MELVEQMVTGALIAAISILFTALINHAFRSKQLSDSMKAKLYYEAAEHIADHFSKFFYVISALSLGTTNKRLNDSHFDEDKFNKSFQSAYDDFMETWAQAKKAAFILQLLNKHSAVKILSEFTKFYNTLNETVAGNNYIFSDEELELLAEQAYEIRSKAIDALKI